jgi:hypothetical protein
MNSFEPCYCCKTHLAWTVGSLPVSCSTGVRNARMSTPLSRTIRSRGPSTSGALLTAVLRLRAYTIVPHVHVFPLGSRVLLRTFVIPNTNQ